VITITDRRDCLQIVLRQLARVWTLAFNEARRHRLSLTDGDVLHRSLRLQMTILPVGRDQHIGETARMFGCDIPMYRSNGRPLSGLVGSGGRGLAQHGVGGDAIRVLACRHADLAEKGRHVVANRLRGEAELLGDLPVGMAVGDPLEDLGPAPRRRGAAGALASHRIAQEAPELTEVRLSFQQVVLDASNELRCCREVPTTGYLGSGVPPA
jgi:hypothetical protein